MWNPDELTSNHTQLRLNPTVAEKEAARRVSFKVGSNREKVFRAIWLGAQTTYEVYRQLALWEPCHCGCTHRGPRPINEISTRFGELRDMGLIRHRMKGPVPEAVELAGGTYMVHILTLAGIEVAQDRFG